MQILITQHIATAPTVHAPYGEVITVSEELGQAWVEAGIASLVVETAVSPKLAETAVTRKRR
jgi:hypothetical protein